MAAETKRQSEARTFREAVSSGNAGVGGSSASSSEAASGVVTSGHAMQKLNLVKANMYKPPQTILFRYPTTSGIQCYIGPNLVARGCNLAVLIDVAIRVVLTRGWALHIKANPAEVCPWDFGDLKNIGRPVSTAKGLDWSCAADGCESSSYRSSSYLSSAMPAST